MLLMILIVVVESPTSEKRFEDNHVATQYRRVFCRWTILRIGIFFAVRRTVSVGVRLDSFGIIHARSPFSFRRHASTYCNF